MAHTVLVTGGTRGIGLALVTQLLEKGFNVIATGSNHESINTAKGALPFIDWRICDLKKPQSVKAFALSLKDTALFMVFHNAGVQQARSLISPVNESLSIADETKINFTAPIELTRYLMKNVRQAQGAWIFVTSGLAISPKQSAPIYCANKAGLRAFCKSFRAQVNLSSDEVTVCEAILPLVDTDMTKGRGRQKISPQQAAKEIIQGAIRRKPEIHVGKIKWVMLARSLFPTLIENIMLKA